jgi:hypothetical protein
MPLYVNTDNGVTMNAEGLEAAILERACNWQRVEAVVSKDETPKPRRGRPPRKEE